MNLEKFTLIFTRLVRHIYTVFTALDNTRWQNVQIFLYPDWYLDSITTSEILHDRFQLYGINKCFGVVYYRQCKLVHWLFQNLSIDIFYLFSIVDQGRKDTPSLVPSERRIKTPENKNAAWRRDMTRSQAKELQQDTDIERSQTQEGYSSKRRRRFKKLGSRTQQDKDMITSREQGYRKRPEILQLRND